jgi:hypothetical protein
MASCVRRLNLAQPWRERSLGSCQACAKRNTTSVECATTGPTRIPAGTAGTRRRQFGCGGGRGENRQHLLEFRGMALRTLGDGVGGHEGLELVLALITFVFVDGHLGFLVSPHCAAAAMPARSRNRLRLRQLKCNFMPAPVRAQGFGRFLVRLGQQPCFYRTAPSARFSALRC